MPFYDILGHMPCVMIRHLLCQEGNQKNRIDQTNLYKSVKKFGLTQNPAKTLKN